MDIATLNTILSSKIATTESDIAEKIKAIIQSASRPDMSTNAVSQSTAELVGLRARLATLREVAALTASV